MCPPVRRLAAAVLFLAAPFALLADDAPLLVFPDAITNPPPPAAPARGLTKDRLAELIGLPSEVFGPTTWVYWDFQCNNAVAQARGYDALVVTFAGDRVIRARLVEGRALQAALRQAAALAHAPQAKPPARMAVTDKFGGAGSAPPSGK